MGVARMRVTVSFLVDQSKARVVETSYRREDAPSAVDQKKVR
jgi:hypothetical protein